MPRRKRLFSKRYRSSTSSTLVGYIFLIVFAIALIRSLLPFIILAGIIWGAYKLWQYWNQQQQKTAISSKEQQNKLISALYKIIQQHHGRVSIIDFAMTAKVTSDEAKSFLDAKAKEFLAEFEVTDSGDVLYVFNTLNNEKASESISKIQSQSQIKSKANFSIGVEEGRINKSVSLSQADLARRFNLSSSSVGRKKFSPDFAQWTQERDPEGQSWYYDADRKSFHPLK